VKVLMLGWEFPPYISGGLGTACYGLTKGLTELGVQVLFVLPRAVYAPHHSHVTVLTPAGAATGATLDPEESAYLHDLPRLRIEEVDVALRPYMRPEEYEVHPSEKSGLVSGFQVIPAGSTVPRHSTKGAPIIDLPDSGGPGGLQAPPGSTASHYGGDLFTEIERYARLAAVIARREQFDVIHAHDWMTYPAGVAAAQASRKPLVVHVHSTEFDRSGEHVNQRIYDIERMGVHAASQVIAVSFLTRNILISRYGASPERVSVVYNAIDPSNDGGAAALPSIHRDEKIVLFLGRITMQKGPEYFLAAAKKVLERLPKVRFIMAGSGDMVRRTIEMAAEMGIGHKVLFTGFLRGDDVARVFKMADLYVMPSVSEPFGIAPLEALSHDVPAIISKQSGVSEVLKHVLKVDFWDVNEMANKIVAVLRHPPLQRTLQIHGSFEVKRLRWKDSAARCADVYRQSMESPAPVPA
jgi:glycogen(starch) synthase